MSADLGQHQVPHLLALHERLPLGPHSGGHVPLPLPGPTEGPLGGRGGGEGGAAQGGVHPRSGEANRLNLEDPVTYFSYRSKVSHPESGRSSSPTRGTGGTPNIFTGAEQRDGLIVCAAH